ncbi:MAG: ROK family protein [Rhodospirillales bacterium]|jgi:fructokinase|nr:ROK family protein [Rhodospirillales bacterium]
MRVGIDLGGTKIEGVLLDETGRERARIRIATPRGDYRATVQAIAAVVTELDGRFGGGASVGVGIPGAVSPATGLIKNANATWLIGRDLYRDLAVAVGREVRIANDANCFAVSEAVDGAGAGASVVFGVILGTGVGGGIAVSGRALTGANAVAGEWGHNPLPWAGDADQPSARCYCGKRGCIETYLSGSGIARAFLARTGRERDAAEIATLGEAGDAAAAEVLDRYADRLARALALVINILDPDVIVLGGGLSNIASLYQAVPPLLPRWVFSDRVATRLVRNRHGDSSGVRGAAWLWPPRPPLPGESERTGVSTRAGGEASR